MLLGLPTFNFWLKACMGGNLALSPLRHPCFSKVHVSTGTFMGHTMTTHSYAHHG